MKQLVEYELENGQTILVEVDLPEEGMVRASRGEQFAKAKERLTEALDQLKPVAQTVLSKLEGLRADEIGVAFGVKLGAKAGIVLASADSEANFTVTLTWKRDQQSVPTQITSTSSPPSNEKQ